MTYEQQQIALCTWAGIVIDKHTRLALPDCNSLDVLAGFEGKLKANRFSANPSLSDAWGTYIHGLKNLCGYSDCIDATAAQRLEALVRVIGLWITDEAGDQRP